MKNTAWTITALVAAALVGCGEGAGPEWANSGHSLTARASSTRLETTSTTSSTTTSLKTKTPTLTAVPLVETASGKQRLLEALNQGQVPTLTASASSQLSAAELTASSFASGSTAFVQKTTTPTETTKTSTLQTSGTVAFAPSDADSPWLQFVLEGTAMPEATPILEEAPQLFYPQDWTAGAPTGLVAASSGSSGSSLSKKTSSTSLVSGSGTTDGPAADVPEAGGGGVLQVLRYACCNGVVVRSTASADGAVVRSLEASEEVWVTDLTPGTGMESAVAQLEGCAEEPEACSDAISEIAKISAIDYYAKVFVPETGEVGYAPLQALFVRPVTPVAGQTTLEVGYGRIADALASALDGVGHPPHCGDVSNLVTVSAGIKDEIYNPETQQRDYCDDLIDCPPWVAVICGDDVPEDDPLFQACIFESGSECGQFEGNTGALLAAVGERSPAQDRGYCVRNVCPGKGTCETCREWFEATGQDETGWRTETSLVDECSAELMAANPDGDLPIQCIGGTKPNCVEYCQQAMQTWNVYACGRYLSPFDSRQFADPADYECGEYPVGVTHAGFGVYNATGELTGESDPTRKVVKSFTMWNKGHSIEIGRIDNQTSSQVSTYDLTTESVHSVPVPAHLGEGSFWVSFNPGAAVLAKDGPEEPILWVNVCAHLPGLTIYGPDVEYNPAETPLGLVSAIDFGQITLLRVSLCATGMLSVDAELAPSVQWADGSLDLSFGAVEGTTINKGPGFFALAIAGSLIPAIGEIILVAVLGEIIAEEILEAIIEHGDLDTQLLNLLDVAFQDELVEKMLPKLDAQTRPALAGIRPEPSERLAEICAQLQPNVPTSHPYYWFYAFVAEQCESMQETWTLEPFQANAGSASHGCYGANQLLDPYDGASKPWWTTYMGQQWYFPWFPDFGCRIGNTVHAEMDEALWPVLRCATLIGNAWFNDALILPEPTTTGLDYLESPGAGPTQEEQRAALGDVGYLIKETCSELGYMALQDLYGDGSDLVELWKTKHGDGGLGFAK